jgi:hypothetical protein
VILYQHSAYRAAEVLLSLLAIGRALFIWALPAPVLRSSAFELNTFSCPFQLEFLRETRVISLKLAENPNHKFDGLFLSVPPC